jgi:SAM-dependent methyltransferase
MIKMRKLKREEDAFGQVLWAVYKGEEVFETIERDDGYLDAMNSKAYFTDFNAWSPHEQKAMAYVKGKVLDIGCGAGRHSLYLQKKGCKVLGIDISPLALKVCRLRGLKKAKLASIDDAKFKPDTFGTIIMMGNNFGLFGNFKKAKMLLRRFHRMTSDDALIIASSRDPYKTSNPVHLQYHELNRKRGRMSGQVRIRVRYQKYVGRWFDYLMVSGEEMKEILAGTGWVVSEFLGSEDPCYIAVIKKVPS